MTEEQLDIRDARGGDRYFIDNIFLDAFGSELGPFGITVYNALVRRANSKDQRCWPSFAGIAKLVRMSRLQVIREIKHLEKLHLIKIERRPRETHIYTLLKLPDMPKLNHPSTSESLPSDTEIPSSNRELPGVVSGRYPNNTHITKHTKQDTLNNNVAYATLPPDTPEIHSLPSEKCNGEAGYTEGQRLFLGKFRRKRFATPDQQAAIADLETTYGLVALKEALTWAAENNIWLMSSIRTRTKNIAAGVKSNGRDSEHERSPGKYANIPTIVVQV